MEVEVCCYESFVYVVESGGEDGCYVGGFGEDFVVDGDGCDVSGRNVGGDVFVDLGGG